jgi:hypothetical protein
MANTINARRPQLPQSQSQAIHQGKGVWKNAKVISQLQDSTNGVPGVRTTGQNWCGPAVGATVARMLGTPASANPGKLMQQLAGKYTNPAGTTPDNMMKMVQDVGAHVDGGIIAGSYNHGQMDAQLTKGNKVIAQIGLKDPKSGQHAAHWVLVTGKDAEGNYLVKDPLRGELAMTPNALRNAVYNAPGLGGVLLPVAPGQDKSFKTPAQLMQQRLLQQQQMQQMYQDGFQQQYGLNDGNPYANPNSYGNPYGNPSYGNPNDFSGRGLQNGVYTENGQYGGGHHFFQGNNPYAAQNPDAFYNYGGNPQAHLPQGYGHINQLVGPSKQYADNVVNQLSSSNSKVRAQGRAALDQLEKTATPWAQQALNIVMRLFGRQPGGGQRPGYNGYGW